MRVEMFSVPSCPHVDDARSVLASCLAELGIDVQIEEQVGAFPSPTIEIDRIDVMGQPQTWNPTRRLDVPTRERILSALKGAADSGSV